ncbi:ATP-binding cassette domain-containing protein [Hominifimenecus sp. rT4P-3]|uniref:ATP-binding cassette domain-containing protein n=1 Tax=Hominifimenecus sp. rT4P-3 TaxID=3242979 RepID=UPI003DA6111A
MKQIILRVFQLFKQHHQTTILDQLSFEVYEGEILGILGRSGSGKSTLCQVLSGGYAADGGKLYFQGRPFSPWKSSRPPIALLNERSSLLPMMTVAQNLFLFEPISGQKRFFAHEKEDVRKAQCLLKEWGVSLEPCAEVKELSHGEQHVLESIKAVVNGAKIILLDEVAVYYNEKDYEVMRKQIDRLKERGITVIYADSRLKPMMEICDRILLLQHGRACGSYFREEVSEKRFGSLLAENFGEFPSKQHFTQDNNTVFCAQIPGKETSPMEICVRSGEIVGYVEEDEAQLQMVAEALSGINCKSSIPIWMEGKQVRWKRKAHAKKDGVEILYGCEDQYHLFSNFSIGLNYCITVLDRVKNPWGIIKPGLVQYLFQKEVKDERLEKYSGREAIWDLDVDERLALYLERLLLFKPKIILIYNFGRGIDFISRRRLCQRMAKECASGMAFLLLSNNELDLEGICSRIYH